MQNNPEEFNLSIEDITVSYNKENFALYDTSFSLSSGTICALVGINGSGKSTLFKSIMGFVTPQKGSVRVNNKPIKFAHKNSWIAYVPQSEDVDWTFPINVWEVVMMGRYGHMNFLRLPSANDKKIVTQSLEQVGMLEYKDRQIGELSGGQKKRVFLARAIAQQGKVILLDEPFTGVDVKTETIIIDLLRDLRDQGCIILVSTHNLGSVPEYCDQVAIINRTIIAFGPTQTTFTAENLSQAFGGALRYLRFDHTDLPGAASNELFVLADDETPLILSSDGKIK